MRHLQTLLFLAALGGTVHAHGDEAIKLEPWQGKVVTGSTSPGSAIYFHGVRVYATGFGTQLGFHSGYHRFSAGTQLGFDFNGPLREWNGSRFVVSPAQLLIRETASGSSKSARTGSGARPGFGNPVLQSGRFHHHYEHRLMGDAGARETADVYLAELRMWADDGAGRIWSDPVFVVYSDHAAAASAAATVVEDTISGALHFHAVDLPTGAAGHLEVHVATPGHQVVFAAATAPGRSATPVLLGCAGRRFDLTAPLPLGSAPARGDEARLNLTVPASARGLTLHLQAIELSTCRLSDWVSVTL